MNKIPKYWYTAKKNLSHKDKVMKLLINKYSAPSEIILTTRKDIFYSLCKSIIGQQISVAAANSVFLKFKKKYLPPEKFVNVLQKRFSPYCSVATWYLWRSIDPEPIQY